MLWVFLKKNEMHFQTIKLSYQYPCLSRRSAKRSSAILCFLMSLLKQEKRQKNFGTFHYTMRRRKISPIGITKKLLFKSSFTIKYILPVSHLACIIPKLSYFPSHHAIALTFLHFKRVRCDSGEGDLGTCEHKHFLILMKRDPAF